VASIGSPNEGLDNVLGALYTATFKLLLYTNTQDSLSQSTVLANLTEPTGEDGYAQITLNGTWSQNNGIFTYDHGSPDDPFWENTGAGDWAVQPAGVAMTDGTYIVHFKDLVDLVTMIPGKQIIVDMSTGITV